MIQHHRLLYAAALLPVVAAVATASSKRAPGSPRAAPPLQVPVNSQFTGIDGTVYTLTGTLALTITPPPTPLTLAGFTIAPNTVNAGQLTTGTVTLSRAPGQDVVVPITAEKGLTAPASITVPAGQPTATFSIGTPATQAADYWYSLSVNYAGGAKLASLLVHKAVAPPPPPTAGPPTITGFLNSDGSPLTVPQWGQEVRIQGTGFGAAMGSVRWQGGSVPVTLWGDGEVRVKLPLPAISGAQDFILTRPDGLYSDTLVPQP